MARPLRVVHAQGSPRARASAQPAPMSLRPNLWPVGPQVWGATRTVAPRAPRRRARPRLAYHALPMGIRALAMLALIALGPSCAPRCEVSSDCTPDGVCRSGRCRGVTCSAAAECAGRERCESGRCAAPPCEHHAECGAERVCVAGACVALDCARTADCPDAVCARGRCRACEYGSECEREEPTACAEGRCVPYECDVSSECEAGRVCVRNQCVPCDADTPCDDGRVCEAGACVPCVDDTQCGDMGACRDGRCSAICAGDGDCPHALGCRGRTHASPCGEPFCDGDQPTPFPRSFVCDPCQALAGGCPSGACDEELRCTCATNDDCATYLACRSGACTRCNEDSHCRCDQYCAAGECRDRCVDDAQCAGGRCHTTGRCVSCITDADCPGAERCFEDGCIGPCDNTFFSCAPFVPCTNGRCGLCANCRMGAPSAPVRACP